jgi:hypothetical protein
MAVTSPELGGTGMEDDLSFVAFPFGFVSFGGIMAVSSTELGGTGMEDDLSFVDFSFGFVSFGG